MNKNRKLIIALVLLDVIVLLACILIYNNSTNDDEIAGQKKSEITEKEAIINLSNYPKVDAVSNMQDLANAFIKNFTGENVDTTTIEYTSEQAVYKRLTDGTVDLIIAKEPSKEEVDYAKQKGVELEYLPLVIDAFVFYVNHDNPVYNLTVDQIKQIYSGKINKWSELGGSGDEIRAYQRNSESENQMAMLKMVMEGTEISSPILEEKSNTDTTGADIIADYDNGINSLGYSYYSYAKKIYDEHDSKILDGIKLLKINDVKPSYDNIRNNTYPLKTIYYVVTRKGGSTDETTMKLRNAMLSNRGKQVAKEAGYVGAK